MAVAQPIPILGLGVQEKSRPANAQRCVNLYYEIQRDADRTRVVAYKTPGLDSPFVNFGDTAVRGVIWPPKSDYCFFVHRDTFYQVDNTGTAVNRGTLNTSAGKVSLAENGTQVGIVDGTNGYTYNMSTTTFAQIVDAQFPNGARTIDIIDGYFVVDSGADDGEFYISDYLDGTSWPGDFGTAESNPDGILRIMTDHQDLVHMGARSLEFWANTGQPDLPFERIPGTTQEVGIAARWSAAEYDGSIAFLAISKEGQIFAAVLRNYRPQRISDHEVEAKWSKYSVTSDAVGSAYVLDGHPMYVLTFPTQGASWMYDSTTTRWSELVSYGLNRHRGEHFFHYLGRNYVTDYANGKVYRLNQETFTDNGEPIRWILVGRHVFDGYSKMRVSRFQLDIETGVGLTTGQGSDPQVMLRVSRDGGRTWGNERWKKIGKKGEYKKRAVWGSCGRGRDFVFEVSGSDPVKTAVLGAGILATGGSS